MVVHALYRKHRYRSQTGPFNPERAVNEVEGCALVSCPLIRSACVEDRRLRCGVSNLCTISTRVHVDMAGFAGDEWSEGQTTGLFGADCPRKLPVPVLLGSFTELRWPLAASGSTAALHTSASLSRAGVKVRHVVNLPSAPKQLPQNSDIPPRSSGPMGTRSRQPHPTAPLETFRV
jgi:hypothetical protein